MALMKSDVELFARLYISCQTRDGNLEDFFQHENQAWPPALSDGGRLRLGTKSDLLTCLEDLSSPQTKAPDATCVVLDGAAIVQMIKPGSARYLMNMHNMYSSHIYLGSCAVCHVWTSFGILTKMIPLKAQQERSVERGLGGMLLGRLPYQETGRTFCMLTATRQNYSVSWPVFRL